MVSQAHPHATTQRRFLEVQKMNKFSREDVRNWVVQEQNTKKQEQITHLDRNAILIDRLFRDQVQVSVEPQWVPVFVNQNLTHTVTEASTNRRVQKHRLFEYSR